MAPCGVLGFVRYGLPLDATARLVAASVLTGVIGHGALLLPALAQGSTKSNPSVPDFSSNNTGWVSIGTDWVAVPGGPAPVTDDPAHPALVTGKPPSADNIASILQNGFTGPLGAMPDRRANALSDADIANLVAYLVSLK